MSENIQSIVRTGDQAEGLRGLAAQRARPTASSRLRCIAVGSGKGGVGKTAVCVGLSWCLAQMGRRVLLLDADLGLANVDIQMGLEPARTLQDVVFGQCSLQDAVISVQGGPDVLPSSSGTPEMADLGSARRQMLADELIRFAANYDFFIIDTGAGIGKGVTTFLSAAPEVLVVVANEPTSIMDAYSLVKVLCRDRDPPSIGIVANMVRSLGEGERLAARLQEIARRFLDIELPLAGTIPFDLCAREAIRMRRTVVTAAPNSVSALCLRDLATYLVSGRRRGLATGKSIETLFGKLMDVSSRPAEGGGQ